MFASKPSRQGSLSISKLITPIKKTNMRKMMMKRLHPEVGGGLEWLICDQFNLGISVMHWMNETRLQITQGQNVIFG